jgi:hypothetical protein
MIASDKVDIAEMTGNSNAELWAFAARPSPHIMQVDKTNGSFIKDFAEPGITQTNPALAFAHWGGDYWAFVMDRTDPSSTVYQMDGVTGAMKSTTQNTGRYIVGAGVSTCAPLVIL